MHSTGCLRVMGEILQELGPITSNEMVAELRRRGLMPKEKSVKSTLSVHARAGGRFLAAGGYRKLYAINPDYDAFSGARDDLSDQRVNVRKKDLQRIVLLAHKVASTSSEKDLVNKLSEVMY